jgi:hypothetical protein
MCDRKKDTSQMLSNHPWASLADLKMFLNGWDMGRNIGAAQSAVRVVAIDLCYPNHQTLSLMG